MNDPSVIVVGDTTPDHVKLPPQLGGLEVRVLGITDAPCPKCAVICPTLTLENGMYVTASCPTHNFVWYNRR